MKDKCQDKFPVRTDNLWKDYLNEKEIIMQPTDLLYSFTLLPFPDDKTILFPVVLKDGKDKRQGVKVM